MWKHILIYYQKLALVFIKNIKPENYSTIIKIKHCVLKTVKWELCIKGILGNPDDARKPTYSVAWANGIPVNDGLSVSVYISIPVPRK